MRHRRLFNLASAMSLLLAAAVLIVSDVTASRQRGIEFWRKGARWEIACGNGNIWLANAPQIRLEEERDPPQLREMRREVAGARIRLLWLMDQYPPGLTEHERLAAMLRLVESQFEAEQAALSPGPRTRPIVHPLRLVILAWLAAILPGVWIVHLVLSRPLLRRELRGPLGIASLALLLISLAILTIWIRSFWSGAEWVLGTRPTTGPTPPAYREPIILYSERGLLMSNGQVQLYERVGYMPARLGIARPTGYRRGGTLVAPAKQTGANAVPGSQHWWVPGITYDDRPTFNSPRGFILMGYRSTIVSLWMPLLICSILPAFRIRFRWNQFRREQRAANQQCVACGYSITGNASGVCPECGTALSQVAKG